MGLQDNLHNVTMIGTLPPIKGISPYCLELVKNLSTLLPVEFIGFKKLYPDLLYPGGTKIQEESITSFTLKNVHAMNNLTYYNPFTWIVAGLTAKGEVIHAQWWSHVLAPIYLTILFLCKVRGKKIVLTVHNVIPHEQSSFNKLLNNSVLSLGDGYIVHSESNKTEFIKNFQIPESRVFVAPHGILEQAEKKGISKLVAREHLNLPPSGKVLLFFGTIRDYKGLDVLLRALPEVRRQIPDVMLIVAGKPWGGWDTYQTILTENGLENSVLLKLDFISPSEIEYYFAACDIVVLPYKYFNSQSGVGALALPFYKPLVVTNVGGLPEYILDKRVIANPNDINDLVEKIVLVLSDDELLLKLSKDSETLSKKYKWVEIAKKTVSVYKEIAFLEGGHRKTISSFK